MFEASPRRNVQRIKVCSGLQPGYIAAHATTKYAYKIILTEKTGEACHFPHKWVEWF